MNKTFFSGNLTREPETFAPQNSEFTKLSFRVANNDKSKKNQHTGDYDRIPCFLDVEHWTKNPQHWLQKLGKGKGVVVTGHLEQQSWTDQNTNTTRSKIILCSGSANAEGFPIEMIDFGGGSNSSQQSESPDDPGF